MSAVWVLGWALIEGKKTSARRKTCSSAMLSTSNPTWAALGLIPGVYGEIMVTNSLKHDIAIGFIQMCNLTNS
jgi:hypothetical protein